VSLFADRSEAHCPSGEPLDNLLGWLDFLCGDRLSVRLELKRATDRAEPLVLLVDLLGVLVELRLAVEVDRVLQLRDSGRVEQVLFALNAVLILAGCGEHSAPILFGLNRRSVLRFGFLGDLFDPDAGEPGGSAVEELVNELLVKSDCLENLRASVALLG
jgi:hypothetical protein